MDIVSQSKLFEYCIPPNETIYKGMDKKTIDFTYSHPSWFSLNVNTANMYSLYTHSVITSKRLKLVNIMSDFFHIFLLDYLHDKYKNYKPEESYRTKMDLIVPLGLPNRVSQELYIKSRYNIEPTKTPYMSMFGQMFGNKSRFSQISLDLKLIELINELLSQHEFDGYIAPCSWASSYHELFPDEICLFNISNCGLLYKEEVMRPSLQNSTGGAKAGFIGRFENDEPIDFDKISIDTMRMMGYTGKIKYDSNGKLIKYDAKWIDDWIAKKKEKEVKEWFKKSKSVMN